MSNTLSSIFFLIPVVNRAYALQQIYIYRLTHMSNIFRIIFLNPCSEQSIYKASEEHKRDIYQLHKKM